MYEKGEIIYLTSDTLCSTDVADFTPAGVHAELRLPERSSHLFGAHRDNEASSSHTNLIYKMVIVDVYTPFSMAVVCRVRLVAVYDSPEALAVHIPLPYEADIDNVRCVEPSSEKPDSEPTHYEGPDYILKLYDRRCPAHFRNELVKRGPYDEGKARAYQKYRQGPPASHISCFFRDMPGYDAEDLGSEKMMGLFEAWLEEQARQMWQKEVSVYNALQELQGKSIPKLYDTISCSTRFDFADQRTSSGQALNDATFTLESGKLPMRGRPDDAFVDWNRVQGILIEFIPGVTLINFIHAALRAGTGLRRDLVAHVTSIADEAMELVLHMDRYPVLNPDVSLYNIMVRQTFVSTLHLDDEPGVAEERLSGVGLPTRQRSKLTYQGDEVAQPIRPRCVAIDFGHARVRFPDETDEQWRCAKFLEDEEDGLSLQLRTEFGSILRELRADRSGAVESYHQPEVWIGPGPLWSWKRRKAWYRELSTEELDQLMEDIYWGHHPDHRR